GVAIADIHPSQPAGGRDREFGPIVNVRGSKRGLDLRESSAIIGRAPDAATACGKPGERSYVERGIGRVIRIKFDVVDATRRAEGRLDISSIACQQRVQADAFRAQEREVRAAVSRFPQAKRREAWSQGDHATTDD